MYYSTSCLSNRYKFSKILDIYNGWSIKNVELGVCNEPDIDLNILKNYDFNYIVHHYFPPPKNPFIINLASQNEQILNKSVFQIIKSIDFCTDFGINLFSFHAGFRIDPDLKFKFAPDPDNIPDYETSFNTFKESVLEIVDYAERSGVKVAIENNVIQEHNLERGFSALDIYVPTSFKGLTGCPWYTGPFKAEPTTFLSCSDVCCATRSFGMVGGSQPDLSGGNSLDGQNKLLLMCELWEFERLFNEIRSDNLGILLDLGHLKINSNILNFDADEFISRLRDKTFAVHLHENNGRVDQHRCTKEGNWVLDMVDKYFKDNDVPCILECKC